MATPRIAPLLMFSGCAEEAMRRYVSIFEGSAILSLHRYGPGQPDAEGSVMHATFSLCGQTVMCIDSAVRHDFGFTPAISIHVTCDTEAEIDRVFAALGEDGAVLMPLAAYPFSRKFGWVQDRFGVSWQVTLADA